MTRRIWGVTCALVLALGTGASSAGAQAPPTDVIVQSTTSMRDSGVLDQLIAPQFARAYPQYSLKFVAVGTGQAIANARAGQGDVLIAHSPPLETAFVAEGFSYEPTGRTMAWNDYVLVGPASDPAGVLARARNDAAGALELIAEAAGAGRATFVSRGDNSGTNTKEREIWGLTGVPRNARNEPVAEGGAYPGWYARAGLGMADTLRLAQQCPFPNGACYTLTDRGTLQQLVGNGAITALPIVMEGQRAEARGGESLVINAYRVYAVNPAKVPAVKLEAARAFLDFVVTPRFQRSLARFPNSRQPGFFPAAEPVVDLARRFPRRISASRTLRLDGTAVSSVPGDPLLGELAVRLARFRTPAVSVGLARDTLDATSGAFRLRTRLTCSGEVFLTAPRVRDLSPLTYSLGRVRVAAEARLESARARGDSVTVSGRAWPASGRRAAVLQIRARPAGARAYRVVRRVRLRGSGSRYRLSVTLPPGRYEVQTRYVDAGVVDADRSAPRRVTVG